VLECEWVDIYISCSIAKISRIFDELWSFHGRDNMSKVESDFLTYFSCRILKYCYSLTSLNLNEVGLFDNIDILGSGNLLKSSCILRLREHN
jgi:hypothetical protein